MERECVDLPFGGYLRLPYDIFETPNPLRHNDFAVLYLSFDNDLITLPIGRIILYPQWIAGKECSFAAYK